MKCCYDDKINMIFFIGSSTFDRGLVHKKKIKNKCKSFAWVSELFINAEIYKLNNLWPQDVHYKDLPQH